MALRFGFQSASSALKDVRREVEAAETAGFDIFQVGDHIGGGVSPLVALGAAAAVTERIRLGTLVLNNDLRHPVVLAQELATLDQASGGRLELGIGAGHSFTEYESAGIPFDRPAVRKDRLAESVQILRSLLDGSVTTFSGRHYVLQAASVLRPQQEHLPILVGVSGRAALVEAARYADVVAPTMLGRTLPDGQHHQVRWEAARLDQAVDCIRRAAQSRQRTVGLHALVQRVVVTDDRERVAHEIARTLQTSVADILVTPFLCLGTHEEMADHLRMCRQRWGIDYYTVRTVAEFEPVIRRLRDDREDVT
jgi:probable F420-dependent oxidoreductase